MQVHLSQFVRQFSFQPLGRSPAVYKADPKSADLHHPLIGKSLPHPAVVHVAGYRPDLCVTKKIEHTQINQIPGMKHQIDVGKMLVNIFLEILVKPERCVSDTTPILTVFCFIIGFGLLAIRRKKLQAIICTRPRCSKSDLTLLCGPIKFIHEQTGRFLK
jgi:hypothetical protein